MPQQTDSSFKPRGIPARGPGALTRAPATAQSRTLPQLLGQPIVDRHGILLGTIDDLLFDAELGCIAYALLVWGGFMGRGERQLVLPWQALRWRAQPLAYVLDADEHGLHRAPCIDVHERWPAVHSTAWHLWVHWHYRVTPYWQR